VGETPPNSIPLVPVGGRLLVSTLMPDDGVAKKPRFFRPSSTTPALGGVLGRATDEVMQTKCLSYCKEKKKNLLYCLLVKILIAKALAVSGLSTCPIRRSTLASFVKPSQKFLSLTCFHANSCNLPWVGGFLSLYKQRGSFPLPHTTLVLSVKHRDHQSEPPTLI
jgi:hypothetical protein